MISNENKQLANWAMDYALKNGCQQAKVRLYSGSNTSFELRDAKMDKLQQASENGLSLYLFVDGRYGTYSTNSLKKKELRGFIKNGIEATRYLAKDEARTLPAATRYYQGGKDDLKLLDNKLASINPDEKVTLARAAANEVMGKDKRIISVKSSYGDGDNFGYIIASNGFEGDIANSWYSLSASVSMKEKNSDARPSSYWYESALFFDDLIKKDIGNKALERTLRKLGQKKVESGKYTMVVDNMNSRRMISPMISALYGNQIQQKNSFLIDKIGTKIGNEKFTLRDEPHIVGARGARYFDGEGVATTPRAIFDKGVLKTYFIDTYIANKMGIAPTVADPSILIMEHGKKDVQGLIADVQKGIFVTGFNGGNSNSTTGDFSYGIEGFLIENGVLTQPISEMNVTGDFLSFWASLTEVGNDSRPNSSWRIPSLVFEDVNFSGL